MKIILENLEDLKKAGIYCIKNTINNKTYIGSTVVSFKNRINSHQTLFKSKTHHNKYLKNSILKYGIECFEFFIIEIIDKENKDLIREKESFYIDLYKSTYDLNGYNFNNCTTAPPLTKEVRNSIGSKLRNKYKTDIEFVEKMKEINAKRRGIPSWNLGLKCDNISDARKELFDDIEVYDINMNFFRKFDNAIEIEKFSKSDKNDLPILDKVPYTARNNHTKSNDRISYKKIKNKIVNSQNIHRAIRNNKAYKGLFFKKVPRNSNISEQTG